MQGKRMVIGAVLALAGLGNLESRLAEQEKMLRSLDSKLAVKRKNLRQQAMAIHKAGLRAGSPVQYVWIEDVSTTNRDAAAKLLSLGLKENLREVELLENRLFEVQAEAEWLRIQRDESRANEGGEAVAPTQGPNLRCQTSPARAAQSSRLRVLEGFGTKRDTLSGLEWNTLGWWLGGLEGDVRACAEGTVAFVGQVNGRGRVVMIDHGSGNMTLYANLREQDAAPLARGARIVAGARLGSALDRFYFEVRRGGQPVDPSYAVPEGSYTF
jgi:septal ring factor EnvC (AmiA/AmiB activator)